MRRPPRPPRLASYVWSIALHAVVIGSATLASRKAPAQAPPEQLYPIELEPAQGVLHGELGGQGTPQGPRSPQPQPQPQLQPQPQPPSPANASPHGEVAEPSPKGEVLPKGKTDPAKPDEAAKDASKEAEREAMREAVRKAMLAPPGGAEPQPGPAGSGTAAPLGSPNGVPGGKSTRPRVSARYASILDGWFSSRVSLRGLDLPWDDLKNLRATVSISITPDRHVSSFSMASGSGNAAYDARVQSSLQAVVSSGAQLPAPPDDEDVPPQITLVFRCRTQERCS